MKAFSFKAFPELTTERLILRQLKESDVAAIYGLRSNAEINRLITRKTPKNTKEAQDFITVCHQEFAKGNRIFWAMELKETKTVIGTIVFHRISLKDCYAEIGYELHPSFHKKGLMSEAMKCAVQFGIQQMKFNIMEAFTHQNNSPSIALLQKHQFVLQPERRDEGFENNRIFQLKTE
ncbi:MAG: GNAT family N-acetyltransferase [Flavobacteriaceae bacterium]|nr:GNAT family N-acetyltransferase [Flavobacteriaceae bacterium]